MRFDIVMNIIVRHAQSGVLSMKKLKALCRRVDIHEEEVEACVDEAVLIDLFELRLGRHDEYIVL